MVERCPDCGNDQCAAFIGGDCMAVSFARDIRRLRAKLTKLEAENARLRRYYVAQQLVFGADQESESFSRLCRELGAARAELEKVRG